MKKAIIISGSTLVFIIALFLLFNAGSQVVYEQVVDLALETKEKIVLEKLNKEEYDRRILALSGFSKSDLETATTSTSTPKLIYNEDNSVALSNSPWPVSQPYPNAGALLPFNRIVAYYGNFYSTRMGILGEFEEDVVIDKLLAESDRWAKADPDTPVIPAIHYIAMVAQGEAGEDGMYRFAMPEEHIQKAYDMAQKIDGILFLDLQIGLSNLQNELPQYEKWMEKETVHLGLDPEFAMHNGTPPGKKIGSFNASDINYAINWLSEIIKQNNLPPKILVVHRFTDEMVQNVNLIKPTPEVQVVLDMDGWGSIELKKSTYYNVIETDPLQFSGLKIFYKNDLKEPSTGLFTPQEALELNPKPIYIQYQ